MGGIDAQPPASMPVPVPPSGADAPPGRTCIACGADDWAPLHRALQRCAACGFVTACELPDRAALERIYTARYFSGEEYADYVGDRPALDANFRGRLGRMIALAGMPRSLYEVGCAYGFWLALMRSRGVRAAGIDLSADAVRHAREVLGVDATCGAFEEQPVARGQFDTVCMWDTLEHLAHPELQVARVSEMLAPGSWFFATTGDIGAPLARREGPRWRLIHPPTHLQYFSRDTATRFLARHGFEVVHIETVPMCRSVHGTLVGLSRFGHGATRAAARIAAAVLPPALTRRLRFTIDLGDIMLLAARRL